MSKYSVIRAELHALISKSRSIKSSLKESQRNRTVTWGQVSAAVQSAHHLRHWHLAYSLLRGRSLAEVEQKVREGNEPDMQWVAEIQKDLEGKLVQRAEVAQ